MSDSFVAAADQRALDVQTLRESVMKQRLLLDLDDELLLVVAEQLPSVALCRLECVCKAFARPLRDLLSLPEIAARN
eukprot:625472-Prymnesium_polylepis.1